MIRRDFLGLVGATLVGSLAQADELKHPDIWLKDDQKAVFESVIKKLDMVERTVGYAKFNLISFDETLKIAKNYPKIGAFTPAEIAYIEEVFYTDPAIYGFYGKRTIENLSDAINEKEVIKIDGTGHYVYRGHSQELLVRIMKDVGKTIILTSGIRSSMKQLSLHLDKIKSENGNITVASRSLVPPAYSYHSVGDFDVGKKGWGHQNFTANFARTEEFWNLQKLSYVSMRYTIGNGDGVRFEPWHVKIV
ncbi:MAG: putative D-alanyl-D-alanine carboxypeptidase [Proteobacteria bacterium]|nr:putative D-alanyl-D-alanine carboxypeptidase [Pseudomonadota bacterium]